MALDPRRQRIRNNLKRMWVMSAAAASAPAGPDYSPADLFEGGTYKGFWLDASNLSTLKQDTGGTTAVAADGDVVGYIADAAGSAGIFTRRVDDTCRPLYKVVSGNSCLRFDGSNDGFVGNAVADSYLTGAQNLSVVCVAQPDSTGGATQCMVNNTDGGGIYSFQIRLSGAGLRLIGQSSLLYDQGITANEKRCYSGVLTGTTQILRRDGVQLGATGTTSMSAYGTGIDASIGWLDFGSPVDFFKGDIYQLFIINRELTGADLTTLESYLAAKASITI